MHAQTHTQIDTYRHTDKHNTAFNPAARRKVKGKGLESV